MDNTPQAKTTPVLDEVYQVVSFKINDEEYGVDIFKVQEINRTMNVTRVPNAHAHIDGVINLRGRVIPVIDLRSCFGLARREHDSNTRIIVMEMGSRIVGVVVDQVLKVLSIPQSVIENTPSLLSSHESDCIRSVAKFEDRLVILLDLEQMFESCMKHEFSVNE